MGIPPVVLTANTKNAAIASGTAATVTSTGTVPAGALMVVVLMVGGASAPSALSAPDGTWTTSLATIANASAGVIVTAIFTKVTAAAVAFSGSFSWTTTATSGEWAFFAVNYPNPSSALDGSVADTQNASGTKTSPSVTPGTGNQNDLLICGMFGGVVGVDSLSVPGGMASIVNVAGTASVAFFALANLALASASATGTKTWTIPTSRTCLGVSFLVQEQKDFYPVYDGADQLVRQMNETIMAAY